MNNGRNKWNVHIRGELQHIAVIIYIYIYTSLKQNIIFNMQLSYFRFKLRVFHV